MNTTLQLLLAAAAVGVLFFASVAIIRLGQHFRGETEKAARRTRSAPATGMTRDSYALMRKLKEQGVPTGAIAGMSATEQQFFLETMSARVGGGTGPRLVRPPAAAVAVEEPQAPLPAAALVTGPIHCPVCRAVIGERSEPGPTMAKCSGCGRRVTTKVDGDRLTVSVSYGLGTPRSSAAIKR